MCLIGVAQNILGPIASQVHSPEMTLDGGYQGA